MNAQRRTDIAAEFAEKGGRGVNIKNEKRGGAAVFRTEIVTPAAARRLQKPRGRYVTVELPSSWHSAARSLKAAAKTLAAELSALLPEGEILIVGLGNRSVTADALGPETVDRLIVTRHLRGEALFSSMRSVCAVAPGVMGVTGIETLEIVRGVCQRVKPRAVIAVDALAAMDARRICRSFQLSDAGIAPGSGAGNFRAGLDQRALGVPVIAVGTPTVADTMIALPDGEKPASELGLLVMPGELDRLIKQSAGLIGEAINLALYEGMSPELLDQMAF